MITLADMGFGLLELLLSKHRSKLPVDLVTAAQNALDAWAVHRNDVVNRDNLEAQRG